MLSVLKYLVNEGVGSVTYQPVCSSGKGNLASAVRSQEFRRVR